MSTLIERGLLFALYEVSIAIGILLLPIALLMQRGGVTIPIHRMVDRVERAYESVE